MSECRCVIDGCRTTFSKPSALIVHQVEQHAPCECQICGHVVPDGFLAIKHAFDEHNRAEYARAYGANSDHIRHRERIKSTIESQVDLQAIRSQLAYRLPKNGTDVTGTFIYSEK